MVLQRAVGVFLTSSGDDWVGVARWRALACERRHISRIQRYRVAHNCVTSHGWFSGRSGLAIRGERAKVLRCVNFHMQLRRRDDAVFRRPQPGREWDSWHRVRHRVDVSVFKRNLIL